MARHVLAGMGQAALIAALAPLLLVQARQARARALRLPEPEGPRAGEAGVGAPLRLLIAGDSAAAGVGVSDQRQALSGHLVDLLSAHHRVTWRLVARTGLRSSDLLAQMQALPVERFDVALLSLGVNDVTGGASSARFVAVQRALVDLLAQRFRVRHLLMSAVPPMQHMTALPRPLRDVLGWRAARFNVALRAMAAQRPGARLLAPGLPFTADMLAEDGFHPSAAAYRLWAEAAARAMDQSLPTMTSLALTTA